MHCCCCWRRRGSCCCGQRWSTAQDAVAEPLQEVGDRAAGAAQAAQEASQQAQQGNNAAQSAQGAASEGEVPEDATLKLTDFVLPNPQGDPCRMEVLPRLADPSLHGTPVVPGPGCPTVIIGR